MIDNDKTFYCEFDALSVSVNIYRDGIKIGYVIEDESDGTIIVMDTEHGFPQTVLSFNEIEIIMDNWNQLIEMIEWMSA